jgi:hypothetical protein
MKPIHPAVAPNDGKSGLLEAPYICNERCLPGPR